MKLPEEESGALVIQPRCVDRDVGQSCIMLELKEKKITLDCVILFLLIGMDALAFVEADEVDLLFISRFDWSALPWFLQKIRFKRRSLITNATRAICRWMLSNYIKFSNNLISQLLYTEADLEARIEKIESMNFHNERDEMGVRFWAYNAGCMLGAAVFMIEKSGVKIVYKRYSSQHLMAAKIPTMRLDILITKSTYREFRFAALVQKIVQQIGRCLIPVFPFGHAQKATLLVTTIDGVFCSTKCVSSDILKLNVVRERTNMGKKLKTATATAANAVMPVKTFVIGEIVFAHICGYAPWPATVLEKTEGKLRVLFNSQYAERNWVNINSVTKLLECKDILMRHMGRNTKFTKSVLEINQMIRHTPIGAKFSEIVCSVEEKAAEKKRSAEVTRQSKAAINKKRKSEDVKSKSKETEKKKKRLETEQPVARKLRSNGKSASSHKPRYEFRQR